MTYTIEKLNQKARELALQHTPTLARSEPKYIRNQFESDLAGLRSFVISLQDVHAGCTQRAEEWLLDNAEFIEEQGLDVREQILHGSLRYMPQLHKQGILRIQALCEHYLELADGILHEDSFISYLNAYQEISALTLAETRSIPLMLRVALVHRIAETMLLVRERREVCLEVDQFLSRIEPSKLNKDTVNEVLDAAGQTAPLSGPWVVHLISHLREWAGDTALVREWLACKYENGSDDLDRIVTYEHQLQATYQVTAGNLITSLRHNERRDWEEFFERISLLDRTLREDGTGVYPQMDASSRHAVLNRVAHLAHRMRVPESLIASQAVALAKEAHEGVHGVHEQAPNLPQEEPNSLLPRPTFAAYYVFEPAGTRKLVQSLRQCSHPRRMPSVGMKQQAGKTYFASYLAIFVILLLIVSIWIGSGQGISPLGWIAIVLGVALPVSEWVMTGLHFAIERTCQPRPLLRYDFSNGVPHDASTMVVIPTIWSSIEEVRELADRLEIHYLANRDANIHYALLGDFTDAAEEKLAQDEVVIAFAKEQISALNRMYGGDGGTTFHLFQRRRQWNAREGVFMGWERKRGKLVEFVELLQGNQETSYDVMSGDASVLRTIRYIITLDADTQLPMGSAQRMIGTMHLPFNRPRLNPARTRVIEGYGVLQPRISVSHESAMRSKLAYFWSEPGMDPYAFAASDPYQDLFAQGIFTGKGIFDVDVFAELLCERIPENAVLSHDLLEGGFLRAGLLSDMELIDDHPSTFMAYQKRMHRWVRGDWQLLCWLYTKVCDRRGTLKPIDLSFLTRWQIIDNLRRSLLPIAYFFLLALAVSVLPGSPWRWVTLVMLTLLIPVIRQIFILRNNLTHPRRFLSTFTHVLIDIWTLPFQTVVLLDAVGKTLYRLMISKKRMLEWTSSFHVERSKNRQAAILHARGGYVLIVLFAIAAFMQPLSSLRWTGLALSLFWAFAPLAIRWLDQPVEQQDESIAPAEQEQLRALAEQIWTFYEDYAGEEDHYLPPDNVQYDPPNGVAHRTSPTNIGFLLTAALAARDFGFITTHELVERLERTVQTIERLDKWQGHLYNWYDTLSLKTLPPAYVSTVDSGNFVASLMTVKQGLTRWLREDVSQQRRRDTGFYAGMHAEFAVELDKTMPDEIARNRVEELKDAGRSDVDPTESSPSAPVMPMAWETQGYALLDRLEMLITSTDFHSLYDHKAKLFVLGFHAASGQRDNILYDLLASEARQTSFVAIALGQISVSHWMALGRTVKRQGQHPTLVSWSGTMFEYMMPWLTMRTYRNTIWESTYRGAVKRQIDYARERGVPFGISESGYYAFDYQMNYQYRAFGVPGLGFKRGLEEDLVVAPYATVMALPFALHAGMENLRQMEELGARGKYGYYEAIDFTSGRMPKGESCKVIRSFMAHHQGMSLLTLANLLLPTKMYDYFHQDKRVKAAELLLIERIPPRESVLDRELSAKARKAQPAPAHVGPIREFSSADTPVPEVNVHSNGSFTTVVSNSGSGFIRYQGMSVTRWREDAVLDPWGSYMYIRDVTLDKLWSPTFQPCRVRAEKQRVKFLQDRTAFERENDGIATLLEITVSPESNAEIRKLTLTNKGSEARILEVTTFVEIALAAPDADKAHPAFTKLFVQTEFDQADACLLARKRPRNEGEKSIWAFHTLTTDGSTLGPMEFESDRAGFIGRGHTLAKPKGIESRLAGTVGSVADPAFVMRRRLRLEPGEHVHLNAVTGVAESRDDAIAMATNLSQAEQAERTFQLAWTRNQIELQHLHISLADLAVYQVLAGRALYTAPLRPEQAEGIAANVKGQQGLWAHGVSGDRPIVMVRIGDIANISFMNKLLSGYAYLRGKGLAFDLVVLNESAEGYQQDLRDGLVRMGEQLMGGQAGIYIVPASSLSEEDTSLLFAVSRVILRADGPSLRAQLQVPRPRRSHEPPLLTAKFPANRFPSSITSEPKDLLFYNGSGGFTPDGREYHIVLKKGHHLPAPWINVMANPRFGCLTSELYTGYTWWRNSRECKLTPWSNDPALDPPGEICYLRDENSGEFWQMVPSRGDDPLTYLVSYGRGYTRYEHESHGLQQEMTVFVPVDDPVKVIQLRLRNTTEEQRHLSMTYYAEWVLGVHREGNTAYLVTDWDESEAMLLARNAYQETFRDATAFLAVHSQTEDSLDTPPITSWTVDRQAFIGRNGTLEHPDAMNRVHLSGDTGPTYDACGAVQTKIVIEPGQERIMYFLLGCEDSAASAGDLVRKYREPHACEQALEEVRKFWDGILDTITVSTPSPEMDVLLNNWLLYQNLSCRMWARTAFYQAGGAFGFRDQLQDSLAMLHSRPDLTRAQILLHASHQYDEGDVQHWWHEETHRGIRTRFSDDLLWLPYAVLRYLEHTEDESILSESVPFLHSDPLGEDEHERYEETVLSGEEGTVLEHCLRALDRSMRFGEHGLPLMGIGDWNDGMSLIGPKGRGESVWLGWFQGYVLQGIADLCERRGDTSRAQRYLEAHAKLKDSLNESGWDGQWYRRAFTDGGQWLGSIHNEECRIDSIAQSWSVISGMGQDERAKQAMRSFDRELVNRSLSLAHILTPPFDKTDPSPGYIQGYPPGIRENGGQYTHGVIWSIVAWSRLGEGNKAFELFHMFNPIMHTRTSTEVQQYVGEPYVMAADVYSEQPHPGHAGWTWYTGASGWMYQAGIEWIIGLRRRGDRLYIQPCIPTDWPGFTATYRYGNTEYRITVNNPSHKSGGLTALSVDGQDIDLRERSGVEGSYVQLRDDHRVHEVVLTL
ncbi:glycosyl transferase family 36 [Paenibacillus selenitireducens]|uniref:Glycosyl transferase family 36 n=1 Tax=Paenibacillus selenitireducens TaxID=1324314 RepID=A0A1T2X326_9BACL|nr:glucoamylase family protein [Paenibacillus selenitireducens]OPA74262.1 glycosyl transferase family 36 [Paenibacillus selenitireducens]